MPKRVPPNDADRHIGQQIRIARLRLKMSQETLGDAMGLTFQQVQKYEKGTNRVSGSRLHQLVTILKLPSVDVLFPPPRTNGTKLTKAEIAEAQSLGDMLATNEGQRFVAAWHRLPSNDSRRVVLQMVEAWVDDCARP